jgi:hypothetical protein
LPVIRTTQDPRPLQGPPLQPAKADLAAAVGNKVTTVSGAYDAAQVGSQLIPGGTLVTVPRPVPAGRTCSVKAEGVNVALTATSPFTVTAQSPCPLQGPPHPWKANPSAGRAVSLTDVPMRKEAVHAGSQLIPPGELSTVPLPVRVTLSVKATLTRIVAFTT